MANIQKIPTMVTNVGGEMLFKVKVDVGDFETSADRISITGSTVIASGDKIKPLCCWDITSEASLLANLSYDRSQRLFALTVADTTLSAGEIYIDFRKVQ